MASLFGRIARGAGSVVGSVLRSPVTRAVPGLGTIATVGTIAMTGSELLRRSTSGNGLPPLPTIGNGGGILPMNPNAGKRTIFGNDPNVTAELKPSVISKGNLSVYYRAPKGYVVMRDQAGDVMGVPKYMARRYGWKPAKKPLLSIRDTNSLKTAGRAIKKLQKAEKMARGIANWHTPHKSAPRNIIVTGKTIGRKAA